jgi:uncharacterized protein YaaR (DUF327 family)
MNWAAFVKKENVRKAEEKLKSDFNVAAKQSITIRDAKSLDIEKDGSFFLIDGTEEGIAKCKELIKEFVESVDEKYLSKAKEKIKEEEEKAAEAFGGILR